jgi:hypothetical protein
MEYTVHFIEKTVHSAFYRKNRRCHTKLKVRTQIFTRIPADKTETAQRKVELDA